MECVKSEFEYFLPEPIVTQIERSFYREYTPISALQHQTPIEFVVPGTDQIYLDLSRSFIYLKGKITSAAGGDNAADVEIGPINNPLHSIFSNVDIELGGKLISDPNGLYPYRAYIETLLSYSKEAQESLLQTAIWSKDTPGKMAVKVSVGGGATNTGLKARTVFFSTSAEAEMTGRLHADIFHQPKAIPQNTSLKVKLTPSKDSFMLMSGADVTQQAPQVQYRFVITDARLFIRSIQVSDAAVLAHEGVAAKSNMRFPIRRVTMKTLAIPQGQSSILHDKIYLGQLPRRLLIGMVADSAMSGHYQQNPFDFQHFDLNHIGLFVNGEMVPSRPYQPNFTTGHYLRDYMSLFQGTDTMFSNRTMNIARTDFAAGYALWLFDLSNDIGANNCFAIPRTGSVRLELKFSKATTATINVICYAEYDAVIEIDKHRNVIAPGQ